MRLPWVLVPCLIMSTLFLSCAQGLTETEVRQIVEEEKVLAPTGLPGPQGERGEQGPAGRTGLKGEAGLSGATGPPGLIGASGLKGDKGPQGIRGPKGDTGLQGPPGQRGSQGQAGPEGGSGATGPTITPTPLVTVLPIDVPPAYGASESTGEWYASDHDSENLSWRSVHLEAYETGNQQGDADIGVVCFNSDPPLGKYLSVDITWDTYVTILDDRSARLNWDGGPTQSERWDSSGTSGYSVGPRSSRTDRYDQQFIDKLLQHDHLEFAVESYDGYHTAEFNLAGFAAAYKPVEDYCKE